MKYFAAQVRTGGGEGFIRRFKAAHPGSGFPVYFLRKEMRERHKGAVIVKKRPLFPGYIFIRFGEDGRAGKNLRFLRETEGFVRFLRSNRDISPLCGEHPAKPPYRSTLTEIQSTPRELSLNAA